MRGEEGHVEESSLHPAILGGPWTSRWQGRGEVGDPANRLSWACSLPLKGGAVFLSGSNRSASPRHRVVAAAASATWQGEAPQGRLWGWTAGRVEPSAGQHCLAY